MKSKYVPPEARIIGKNLQKLRKSRGINQTELARIMDVSFQQIQKYEKGVNRLPVDKLHRAKEILHVPYDLFFQGLETPQDSKEPDPVIQKIHEELKNIHDMRTLFVLSDLVNVLKTAEYPNG